MSGILLALSITVCGANGCAVKTTAINMNAVECSIAQVQKIREFQTQGLGGAIRNAECAFQAKGVVLKFAD